MPSPELDLTFTINVPTQADEQALMSRILRILAARYRAFASLRFNKFSKGAGSWKPLKPATIKAKERRRRPARINKANAEQVSIAEHFERTGILVDTGHLEKALNPKMVGGMTETYSADSKEATVKIAFAGRLHEGAGKSKGQLTIAKLASIHHFGAPSRHIPARPILVEPDANVRKQMEVLIEKEIQGELNK